MFQRNDGQRTNSPPPQIESLAADLAATQSSLASQGSLYHTLESDLESILESFARGVPQPHRDSLLDHSVGIQARFQNLIQFVEVIMFAITFHHFPKMNCLALRPRRASSTGHHSRSFSTRASNSVGTSFRSARRFSKTSATPAR